MLRSDLRLAGSCRMCLVEVKGGHYLWLPVAPADNGMEIETDSPDIVEARRVVLELLAARHDFNCQICEKKNGECNSRIIATSTGVKDTRFTDGGREIPH